MVGTDKPQAPIWVIRAQAIRAGGGMAPGLLQNEPGQVARADDEAGRGEDQGSRRRGEGWRGTVSGWPGATALVGQSH